MAKALQNSDSWSGILKLLRKRNTMKKCENLNEKRKHVKKKKSVLPDLKKKKRNVLPNRKNNKKRNIMREKDKKKKKKEKLVHSVSFYLIDFS